MERVISARLAMKAENGADDCQPQAEDSDADVQGNICKAVFEFYKSAPKTFRMPKRVLDWKESIKEMHAKATSEKFQGAAMKIEADTSAAGDLLGEDQPQAVADNQSDKAQEQAAKEDDKQQETPSAQADTQKAEDTETVLFTLLSPWARSFWGWRRKRRKNTMIRNANSFVS